MEKVAGAVLVQVHRVVQVDAGQDREDVGLEEGHQDLEPDQLEYTRKLLGWLVCSKRPLKWSEIQLALSINMDDLEMNELDEDRRLVDDPEDLCGSLVQLLKGNRIELVHSTARQ